MDGKIVNVLGKNIGPKNRNKNYVFIDISQSDFSKDEFVHSFVKELFEKDFDALAILADCFNNYDTALNIIMHIRLSLKDLGNKVLIPILFVTDSDIKLFLKEQHSQILLTISKGLYVCSSEDFRKRYFELKPLAVSEYVDDFLNRITILPKNDVGNHAIANRWGAYILNSLINSGIQDNYYHDKIECDLYFKYTFAKTIRDYSAFFENTSVYFENNSYTIEPYDCGGKRILLIDDEANRGWDEVLRKLLVKSNITTLSERMADNDDLPQEILQHILKYDLILLDLRVNGKKEENIQKTEDLSGFKILKRIKEINSGIQVIMFTASTRMWNLQKITEAGANGYYVKESPAYHFSREFSYNNAKFLIDQIDKCLSHKSGLRGIEKNIDKLKSHFQTSKGCECFFRNQSQYKEFKNDILNQMEVAYRLFSTANTKDEYSYSFCALEKIIELFVSSLKLSPKVEGKDMLFFQWENSIRRYSTKAYDSQKDIKTFNKFANYYYRFILNRDPFKKNDRDLLKENDHKDLTSLFYWINYRNDVMHPNKKYYWNVKKLVDEINGLYDYLFKVCNSI